MPQPLRQFATPDTAWPDAAKQKARGTSPGPVHIVRYAGHAYASSASSTFPFVSIPTKCTVAAAISGTTPIR